MKLGVLVFARYNSSRYYGKVLKKIGKKTILDIIIHRLKLVKPKLKIIIATSNQKEDKKIINHCKKNNYTFFIGNLNNVMKRASECCKIFNLTHFLRICADRPFLDFKLIEKTLKNKKIYKYDLVSNRVKEKAPKGLTFELIKLDKFNKIKTNSKSLKEHICNYYYRNKKKFKILEISPMKYTKYKKYNFAIDNRSNHKKATDVYKNLRYKYNARIEEIYKVFNN